MRTIAAIGQVIMAALLSLATMISPGMAADCTVNINEASAGALAECLQGIGQVKAEAIVADREIHGPFTAADDLQRVDGIGPQTVADNRDRIRFDTPAEPSSDTAPVPDSDDADSDTFLLASWNVRNLSSNARSDAELGLIALILFRYDFIALEEILDVDVIFRLQLILNDDFGVRY